MKTVCKDTFSTPRSREKSPSRGRQPDYTREKAATVHVDGKASTRAVRHVVRVGDELTGMVTCGGREVPVCRSSTAAIWREKLKMTVYPLSVDGREIGSLIHDPVSYPTNQWRGHINCPKGRQGKGPFDLRDDLDHDNHADIHSQPTRERALEVLADRQGTTVDKLVVGEGSTP